MILFCGVSSFLCVIFDLKGEWVWGLDKNSTDAMKCTMLYKDCNYSTMSLLGEQRPIEAISSKYRDIGNKIIET